MSWNFRQNGEWASTPVDRRQSGSWLPIGGDTVGTGGAFLFEGFEDSNYNMMADTNEENESFSPNYDDAIVISPYARVGNNSLRLRIDYDWNYPDGIRRGTNKPICDNRDLIEQQGYSQWGEPFWFAFSLGLDSDWQPDSLLDQVHEFHRELSENPGSTNQEKKDYSGSDPGKPITTLIDGNQMQFRNSYVTDGTAYDEFLDGPTVSAGNWYDIVMNLKWVKDDMDDTGFIRVWVNGEQYVDYSGNTTALDVAPPRAPELRIYKWQWDNQSPDLTRRQYYFDEVRFGWGDAQYSDMVPGPRQGTSGESIYPEWWP